MLNQIVSGVMPVIVQAIISILCVLVSIFVNVGISYLKSKKQQLIDAIGVQKYNAGYQIAKAIFFAVEQQFKGQIDVADEKRKMFDSLMIKKIPYLTQEEIDHFRESVVGEINNQLKNSQLLGAGTETQLPDTSAETQLPS